MGRHQAQSGGRRNKEKMWAKAFIVISAGNELVRKGKKLSRMRTVSCE